MMTNVLALGRWKDLFKIRPIGLVHSVDRPVRKRNIDAIGLVLNIKISS